MDRMKYELRITEAQEPAWQAFTQRVTAKMAARAALHQQRSAGQPMTVSDRISYMRQRSSDMTDMAAAMETLYAELTPEQRQHADTKRPMGFGRMH